MHEHSDMTGKTIGGRYHITRHLGGGGFGQTFYAEDSQLPGRPACVVKQLKPQCDEPGAVQIARRLFEQEVRTQQSLAGHEQIPRLLAHVEEGGEFYLVQEFIDGTSLQDEMPPGSRHSEAHVAALLRDLLDALAFVHGRGVVHRDIKPANLIRRRRDGRIVLIDFGAVKQMAAGGGAAAQSQTVAVGSDGYAPAEQLAGHPQFSSDLYAAGVVAIQALTGVHPAELRRYWQTGELIWRDQAQISPALAGVIAQMTCYDYRRRFPTAAEALAALEAAAGRAGHAAPATNARPDTYQPGRALYGTHLPAHVANQLGPPRLNQQQQQQHRAHQAHAQQSHAQQAHGNWQGSHTQPPPRPPFADAPPRRRTGPNLTPLWAGLATLFTAALIGVAGGLMTIYRIAVPPRVASFAQQQPSAGNLRVPPAAARTPTSPQLPSVPTVEVDSTLFNSATPAPTPTSTPTPTPRVTFKGLPPALSEPTYLSINVHHGDRRADDKRHTFDSDDGFFEANVGTSGSYAGAVTINFRGNGNWYSLDLAAPDGGELSPGSYEDAQRFPFHKEGRPGLDFGGNGAGCNEVVGRFHVNDIVYTASNEIKTLDVNFERRCKGSPDTIYGRLRYTR